MEDKTKKTTGTKKKTSTSSKSSVKDTSKKTTTRATTKKITSTGAKKTASSGVKKTTKSTTTKKSTGKTPVERQVEKVIEKPVEHVEQKVVQASGESLNKIYRKLIFSIVVLFLCLFLVVFALTYGFFTYSRSGRETNKVTTADFNVILDDAEDLGINQQDSFPVYDEVGRGYDPHTFSLKNLGTVEANYVMRLIKDEEAIAEDGCSNNLLADESVKMQLIKDGVVVKESLLSELDDYKIDSGFIGLEEGVNKMYSYELRLWITSEAGAEVMGRHYHGKIQVELSDPANS